jgi:hypothetical protein
MIHVYRLKHNQPRKGAGGSAIANRFEQTRFEVRKILSGYLSRALPDAADDRSPRCWWNFPDPAN